MHYWPILVPVDTESVSLIERIERIAAESKYMYLREGRESKQIIPSLKDVLTGRFYHRKLLRTYGLPKRMNVGILWSFMVEETWAPEGNHWPWMGDHSPATYPVIEPGPQQWQGVQAIFNVVKNSLLH